MNNNSQNNNVHELESIMDIELDLSPVESLPDDLFEVDSKKISDSIENIVLDDVGSIDQELSLEVDDVEGMNEELLIEVDNEVPPNNSPIDEIGLEVDEVPENDIIGKVYNSLDTSINLGSGLGSFMLTPILTDEEEVELDVDEVDDGEYELELEIEDIDEKPTVDIEQLDAVINTVTPNNSQDPEVNMQLSLQRSKERLIQRQLRTRKNTSVEDSRAKLESMITETINQVKAYCNNINESFTGNVVKRKTKNSNDVFFGLLTNIFGKLYVENISEGKEPITPEEFMDIDIKNRLEELGTRLPEDTLARVKDSVRFTPSDLVGTEWQIIRIINRLKEEIEIIKSMQTTDNMIRNNSSNIRTQIVRKYTPNTLKFKDAPYCYVKKLNMSGTSKVFVCGNCNEQSVAQRAFYTLGILPFQGEDKNLGKVYQAVDIPASNKCEHCGHYNILTFEEVERLSKETMKLQKALMEDYAKSSNESCSAFAMTRYRASRDLIMKTLPVLEEENELELADELDEVAVTKDNNENDYSVTALSDAHRRYREMISFFKDNIDYDAIPTINPIPHVVNASDITNKRFIFNSDIEENNKIYQTDVFKLNLANLAKIIAGIVGVKYKDLKHNAVNSIIMHLKDSKIYHDLCYTNTEGQLIASKSKEIANYLDKIDSSEQIKVITTLCGTVDYKYTDIIDETTNTVKTENLEDFKLAVNKYFNKLELLANEAVARRDKLIEDLKANIRIFAFIPLANIPVITGTDELLYNKKFVDFLNETANMMVIMHLSEKFLKYWKTILGKSDAKVLTYLADINKSNNFNYAEKILNKTGIMQFENRYKATQKENDLYKIFTLLHDIDLEQLAKFDGIRQAYEDGDIFTLMEKIESASFMEGTFYTTTGEYYTYDTSIFAPIRKMMSALIPVAKEFISKYGKGDSARLKYYLSALFTEEEIDKVDARRYKNMKLHILTDKHPGESISSYLKRLSSTITKTDVTDLKYFTSPYQSKVDEWEVLLIGANLPLMFFENTIKQIKEVITVIDLLYLVMQRDMGSMLNIIQLPKALANKLISQDDYIATSEDKNKMDAKNYLIRSFYLKDAFNFTGNLADVDISNDNADDTLSVGESDEDRIKIITSDGTEFENATQHLPKEVIQLINEFYTIR